MRLGFVPTLFLHDQETSQFFLVSVFRSHMCFSAVFSTDTTEIPFPFCHDAASHLIEVFFPGPMLQTNSHKFHTFAYVLIIGCHVRKHFFPQPKSLNFSLYDLMLSKFLFSLLLLFKLVRPMTNKVLYHVCQPVWKTPSLSQAVGEKKGSCISAAVC